VKVKMRHHAAPYVSTCCDALAALHTITFSDGGPSAFEVKIPTEGPVIMLDANLVVRSAGAISIIRVQDPNHDSFAAAHTSDPTGIAKS
jgi:hypothetical protein